MQKWYRVIMHGSFYDDMVGKLTDETDKTFKLYFNSSVGSAIFYKHQVKFEDEF